MSTDSDLRRRTAGTAPKSNGSGSVSDSKDKKDAQVDSGFSFLDILRVLSAVALLSTLGSYMTTNGRSYVWGIDRPWWTQPKAIQAWINGPLLLTNEQLSAYDGSDPEKPILLALNRTIYDVSSSPNVYGPQGMYASLAAKDASRSYITTCFDPVDDLVPYFGGVEEVYVPIWLSKKPGKEELDAIATGDIMEGMGVTGLIESIQKRVGKKRLRLMREEAYRNATERVRAQVKTWEGMFARKQYPIVGKVVGVDEEDPKKWKHLGFCEAALNQRPPIAESLGLAMKAVGERDGHPDGNINIGKMKSSKKNKEGGIRAGIPKADPNEGQAAPVDPDAEAPLPWENPETGEMADATIEDMKKGGKYGVDGEKAKKAAEKKKKEKQDFVDKERAQRKKASDAEDEPADEL